MASKTGFILFNFGRRCCCFAGGGVFVCEEEGIGCGAAAAWGETRIAMLFAMSFGL